MNIYFTVLYLDRFTRQADNSLDGQYTPVYALGLRNPFGITVDPAGNFELFTSLLGSMAESKDQMTVLGFIFVGIFLVLVVVALVVPIFTPDDQTAPRSR